MQVKKTFKETKAIVQEGSKAFGMGKLKVTHIPMKETNLQKIKIAPNFIIWNNPGRSLVVMKVDLLHNKFSKQED